MTTEEISKLPTILEILDQIAMEEEWLRSNPRYGFLSDLGVEDKFEIRSESPDGPCVLYPTSSIFNSFFRGQNEFYEECHPSIFRQKNRDDIDIFIDRLRSSEFELLLRTHPFVKLIFDEGIIVKNFDQDVLVSLKVDYLSLAQHYGLNTDVLDFTNDKWVAAFFAVCKKNLNKYYPIASGGYGVVYRYTSMFDSFENNKLPEEFRRNFFAIGLQPFARPGEQKGFGLKLSKGENLNEIHGISAYKFRHNALASEIIFNRMNRGQALFPNDEIEEYTKKIEVSKKISTEALNITLNRYPIKSLTRESLIQACKSKGIKFVNYPVAHFPKTLEQDFKKHWHQKGEKEFFSKVVYRQYHETEQSLRPPSFGQNHTKYSENKQPNSIE